MEEGKISFFKKIKYSIYKLENYQILATQKVRKTIGYLAILMAIFALLISICITYKLNSTFQNISNYIEQNINELNFKNGILSITAKDKPNEKIVIEDLKEFNGKIIIDTSDITEEQEKNYKEDIKSYYNGIIILKDKVIIQTNAIGISATIPFQDIVNDYHIVNVQKQDIINFSNGSGIYKLDLVLGFITFIALFINYFSLILLDAIMYSLIGYIIGIIVNLRLRFSAIYNIASHSLTLPIILNLIYSIINILTGYTIKYFSVMYMAITCIYIFTAILMIKSDVIKKQFELSKIIAEQERIRAEMARKEQEQKEEEERERVRKEDEKKRQEEKKER